MQRLCRPLVLRSVTQSIARRPAAFQQLAARNFSDNVPKTPVDATGLEKVASLASDPTTVDLTTQAATAVSSLDDASMVARFVMETIDSCHSFFGIPYWEAIVLATVTLRVLMIPLTVKAAVGGARMAVVNPILKSIQEKYKPALAAGDTKAMENYQLEVRQIFVTHKINPIRNLLMALFQFPIFISVFMGLQHMGNYYPAFANDGIYWFTNLGATDPYYALPVINAALFLALVEVGADGMDGANRATMKNVMRGLSVVMIPITASMPTAMFMYWIPNSLFGLAQTSILKIPSVKKALGMPDRPKETASPSANPLQNLTDVSPCRHPSPL